MTETHTIACPHGWTGVNACPECEQATATVEQLIAVLSTLPKHLKVLVESYDYYGTTGIRLRIKEIDAEYVTFDVDH